MANRFITKVFETIDYFLMFIFLHFGIHGFFLGLFNPYFYIHQYLDLLFGINENQSINCELLHFVSIDSFLTVNAEDSFDLELSLSRTRFVSTVETSMPRFFAIFFSFVSSVIFFIYVGKRKRKEGRENVENSKKKSLTIKKS
jgi:hypothetical protein